ncbi:Ethylene receptor 2 [Hibiscus syriacus]|uniref:Ethylene receptor 2 n=1 Tax=Hibiscus syriacus TaxID=106335 RepID=A0A6A3CRC1_HIBSY|nr:Ethylene receptor 2 [Hibiscus syriacus]
MLALTVFKILNALVSCATAITFIPLLLKVKVRELMLKKNAWNLGQEVGLIMKQKEIGAHVRMLTQEIRKLLDRHAILYTEMVELSKTLGLQNYAVWMPNEIKTVMNLTHELKGRNYSYNFTIPISDPDVVRIKGSDGVNILDSDLALATASNGEYGEPGPVAAIRMPMLRVSNFKGGTPQLVQTCYAILVCVFPSEKNRSWSNQELEIVKVVIDQVAVALSHAAVLEESQHMRDQLKVMSDGTRRPMHSILGLLSMMQDGNLNNDQRIIVDSMMKTSSVLSTLINDVMDISTMDSGRSPLVKRSLRLHSMIKESAFLAKCLSVYRGFSFSIEIDKSLPDLVYGDDRRVFQVILHMVGSLLDGNGEGGTVVLQLMHGNIWVVQNPRGSAQNMALVIRFQVRPSISITINESGESSDQPCSNSLFKGLQVLLADDDDLNRAIVFLEVQMPDLDGYEVTMGIRKFRSRNWLLIVPMTASAEEDTWEKCSQIGINGVIRKPVMLQEIAIELRNILMQANHV